MKHTDEQLRIYEDGIKQLLPTNSYKEIAKSLGISSKTVWKIVKACNLMRKNKHKCDSFYFNDIDCLEKAQLLGMLAADGSISSKGNGVALGLQGQDIDYLVHFKKCLQAEHPITKNIKTDNYKITIADKQLKCDLQKLHIVPNKTYKNLSLPAMADSFLPAFVLGYFEGDGCIGSYAKNNTRDNIFMILIQENMANVLKQHMEQLLSIEIKMIRKDKCKNNLFVLCVRKTDALIKLYHFLYDGATFVMKRKHDKWLLLMNIFKDKGYDVGILRSFQ